MTRALKRFPLFLVFLACSSDGPAGVRITNQVTLDGPLAQISHAKLLRVGTGFLLVGYEKGTVRWGQLSEAGVLSQETSFALAEPEMGPFFAATKKAIPGDQVVAVMVNANAQGTYQLEAVAHGIADAAPAAKVVLATFPSGTQKEKIQVTAGVAKSGNIGVLAWGVKGASAGPSYLFLGPNAAATAPPGHIFGDTLVDDTAKWECLNVIQTSTALGLSVVYPSSRLSGTLLEGAYIYERFEMSESEIVSDAPMQLRAGVGNCRMVGGPVEGGYVMAWQNPAGIYMGRLYIPKPGSPEATVISHMVLASSQFSRPDAVPEPAWVSPAGNDVVIGLNRPAGPLVVRYNYDGYPSGKAVDLRSVNGNSGPMSAWVGADRIFVTYTDQAGTGAAASVRRYFMQVETPAKL